MASTTTDGTGDIAGDHREPKLARLSWLTAFFFVLFSLLSMTAVTIALVYTINDKQGLQDRLDEVQAQNACRSSFAQASDLAVLTAFEAVLETDQNLRTQRLNDAREIVKGASELRKTSQEVCSFEQAEVAPPQLTSVPG